MTCRVPLAGQHVIAPDSSLMFGNPNLKFESMCYENPEETEANILPVILKNFNSQYIHLPAKTVIAFAKTEEESEIAYAEVAEIDNSTYNPMKNNVETGYQKENPSQTW